MWKPVLSIVVFVSLMLALGLASQEPTSPVSGADAGTARLRVGTYDNRGILMAWFHSEFNDIERQIREHRQAIEAGDEAAAGEMIKLQQRFHFQGFGRAPVTKLLADVEDQLPALAKQLGIDVIAFDCNYTGDEVEVVDITLDLAGLFDPTPETLKVVREVMKHDPVALEELVDRASE